MTVEAERQAQPRAGLLTPGRVAAAGAACLMAAAGLLWARFGAAVFVDGLNAVVNCF